MSVALMTMAFKAEVPATQKLVLLALCDSANDQGECYPSIPTLMHKCSLGERAVQGAIGKLEELGLLRREFRTGRSTTYWMTPDTTPARRAPPHQMPPASRAPTPAPDAPPPPHHVHPTPAPRAPRTVIEPSVEPSRTVGGLRAVAPSPPTDWDDSKSRNLIEIPVDFDLPESWGKDAESLGWKSAQILKQSDLFRLYWSKGKGTGKRRTVKGWRQSWINWLGKAERMAA